jgi:exodeoxyribonuclease III
MRLVTWNCCMAFEKKAKSLFELQPDIAVIPECSEKSKDAFETEGYRGLWFGVSKSKGLGVFFTKEWDLKQAAEPSLEWIVPIQVKGPREFTLVAVWVCPPKGSQHYVGMLHDALDSHPDWFNNWPTVVAGDFNSSEVWDKKRTRNHSSLVARLADSGLTSAYQGDKSVPTYHQYRHEDKPYHIDYIFLPHLWAANAKVEIGKREKWTQHSDHYPLSIEIPT